MADWFLHTGVYLLGIALIPVVGVLLIAWGVWGDRSKGRSRCPKCWYDMRGSLPKLECPECGHDAKQERCLYMNRRRWRPIVLGIVLVLLSWYPLTIIGGWHHEQAIMWALPPYQYFGDQYRIQRIGPEWLVSRLPPGLVRFYYRECSARAATDEGLALCGKLRYLQQLDAYGSQVTDPGLVHLEGLAELDTLNLRGSQVTDAGLVHLQVLPRLRFLNLSGTRVTDAGVVELKQALPDLDVRR